ncbi:MAG: SocA family protein [Pirellulaceae bacterium]|nr:SocA family protein [Pirellulaceae bacterium]
MNLDQGWRLRLAVLSTLVRQAPQKPGRTALMKFAYLLQTVKGVPLGYRFELYNYGPYDSAVLSDLSQAESLRAIKLQTVSYQSGSGYEYSPIDKGCNALCSQVADQLAPHSASIKWVLDEFGGASASRLELISTIVFAEREMRRKKQSPEKTELCRRVKRIKPHFTDAMIAETTDELSSKQLISIVLA